MRAVAWTGGIGVSHDAENDAVAMGKYFADVITAHVWIISLIESLGSGGGRPGRGCRGSSRLLTGHPLLPGLWVAPFPCRRVSWASHCDALALVVVASIA